MMDSSRPLDALNMSRGKRVMVETKGGRVFIGTLKAFDIHINTVLENAEEHQEGQLERKVGMVFLRGDTVTMISPE